MVPVCMLSAVAVHGAYVIGKKGRVLEKTALTLVLAGGASNLYDRLKRGYVVDYFSIQWKKLKKVVFNLGDIFILPDRPCLRQSSSWRSSAKFFRKKKSFLRKKSNSGSRTQNPAHPCCKTHRRRKAGTMRRTVYMKKQYDYLLVGSGLFRRSRVLRKKSRKDLPGS